MKPVSLKMLAVLVPALSLCLYAEQQAQVITAATLARQPAGTPYVLDLRAGSVYSVSADVASRVRIGTITLADLARKLRITGPTLEVTMISAGRVANLPAGGVTYAPQCVEGHCTCVGTKTGKDCSELSKGGNCKATAAAESAPLVCGVPVDLKGTLGCACETRT